MPCRSKPGICVRLSCDPPCISTSRQPQQTSPEGSACTSFACYKPINYSRCAVANSCWQNRKQQWTRAMLASHGYTVACTSANLSWPTSHSLSGNQPRSQLTAFNAHSCTQTLKLELALAAAEKFFLEGFALWSCRLVLQVIHTMALIRRSR